MHVEFVIDFYASAFPEVRELGEKPAENPSKEPHGSTPEIGIRIGSDKRGSVTSRENFLVYQTQYKPLR